MLYYCAYTWNPGVTIEDVGPAILEQHDAGTLHPEWIRGYYGLIGGGAGFLILDVDDPQALNEMLAPSMRYMTWDIRAIVPYDYDQDIEEFRQAFGQPVDGGLLAEPVEQSLVEPLPNTRFLPIAQSSPAGRAAAAAEC